MVEISEIKGGRLGDTCQHDMIHDQIWDHVVFLTFFVQLSLSLREGERMENYCIPKVAEPFLLGWSIIESLSQCCKGEGLHRTNEHIYFLLRKIFTVLNWCKTLHHHTSCSVVETARRKIVAIA